MIENEKTVGKRPRLWRAEGIQVESRGREQKEVTTGRKGVLIRENLPNGTNKIAIIWARHSKL